MSRKQIFLIAALMMLCVGVGMFIAADFGKVPLGLAGPNDVKLGADNAPVQPSRELSALNDAFVAVSKAVTPQVVSITVTTKVNASSRSEEDEEGFDPFDMFRGPQNAPQRGSGSGVIISPDGYILTNNHVVESASPKGISVELNDGRQFDATLIGRDELTDLAVIKIEATDLPTATFGNSDEAHVGEIVIAVGNPLGLNSTVTQGIVSALGRGQLNLNRDREGYGVEDFIQTDAAINPGNSGGGLFDLSGRLIGINSAIATRTGYYQGYGFAIPINLARAVAQDLIDDGKINRGYIGVRIESVKPAMAKALGLPAPKGVLVQNIQDNSAAANAGLRPSDVILQVDGMDVNTPNHLQNLVARKRAGDDVVLTIFRDGKSFTKTVRLRPREESAEEPTRPARGETQMESDTESSTELPDLGMEIRPLTPEMKKKAGVSGGVYVPKTEPYGEAQSQGLYDGDIIMSVKKEGESAKPVSSPSEFASIVQNAKAGDVLLLQVRGQNNATRLVALQIKK